MKSDSYKHVTDYGSWRACNKLGRIHGKFDISDRLLKETEANWMVGEQGTAGSNVEKQRAQKTWNV